MDAEEALVVLWMLEAHRVGESFDEAASDVASTKHAVSYFLPGEVPSSPRLA